MVHVDDRTILVLLVLLMDTLLVHVDDLLLGLVSEVEDDPMQVVVKPMQPVL